MSILKRKWKDCHLFLYLKYKPVPDYTALISYMSSFAFSHSIKLASHSLILPQKKENYIKSLHRNHLIPEASPIIPFSEIVKVESGSNVNSTDQFLIIITRDSKLYLLPGRKYNFLCYSLSASDIKDSFYKSYLWWISYQSKKLLNLITKREEKDIPIKD